MLKKKNKKKRNRKRSTVGCKISFWRASLFLKQRVRTREHIEMSQLIKTL